MKDLVNIIPKRSGDTCLLVVFWFVLLGAVIPVTTFAHSAERGLVMLLPTGFYVVGGALAVICSFVLLAIVPARWLTSLGSRRLPLFCLPVLSTTPFSLMSFVGMVLLIIVGLRGSTDPLSNPLPLVIWTLWWVGFTVLQFMIGDLWKYLNPWSGLVRIVRRFVFAKPVINLSPRLGYSVAILQFFAVAWFELVDLAPEDPARLAVALSVYWLINFIGIVFCGERQWFDRAEPFSIFFRLVGACSPIIRTMETNTETAKKKIRCSLAWPGQGVLTLPSLPISGVLFVLLTLSAVSFDALAKTFAWLGFIGINPLEFPGRSAVQGSNTVGLVVTFVMLASLFLLSVYCGWRVMERRGSEATAQRWVAASGRLVYSIIPISIAFHMTHYLTVLLVNGQYAVIALSDPLDRGWGLVARGFHPTTSFLNDLHSVSILWTFQTVVVVAGHIIGIVIAHLLALEMNSSATGNQKSASLSQVFLALLMVGYTVFGLWLLSTASIG